MADELPLKLEDLVDEAYLAQKILEHTRNGAEIIEFFLNAMRNAKYSIHHRMKAAEWLANRVWGKPRNNINISGKGVLAALYNMSDEELEKLLEDA